MKYRKFDPNEYVMVIKNGRTVRQGPGLSVLYNEFTTNLMVAPSSAFDGAFAFDEIITKDYQSVFVQGVTTYMIRDFAKAMKMFDFAYQNDKAMEAKKKQQIVVLERRINNIIKAIVIREVSGKDIRTVIRLADEMAQRIEEELRQDEAVKNLGVSIEGVNILGINPKPETRKALEAAAREQILKEQDDAIYKRRNAAIEQERIIKENEINTEIKVAEKEQEMRKKAQDSELALRTEKQEKDLALKEMAVRKNLAIQNDELEGRIEIEKKNEEFIALESANGKLKADQEAYRVEALVKAYNNFNQALLEACVMGQADPATIMARAFMMMGENADKIGTLNMTPDILQAITAGAKSNKR